MATFPVEVRVADAKVSVDAMALITVLQTLAAGDPAELAYLGRTIQTDPANPAFKLLKEVLAFQRFCLSIPDSLDIH